MSRKKIKAAFIQTKRAPGLVFQGINAARAFLQEKGKGKLLAQLKILGE
jgi:hypothetical protein